VLDLYIDLRDRRDLAGTIYRQVREAIVQGRLRGGDALPPSREFAARLGVSRTTVTVAYDRLVGEGFATSKLGAGTFVTLEAARLSQRHHPHAPVLRPRDGWDRIPLPADIGLLRRAIYDFRAGRPDERLFPHETWHRLLIRESRALVGHHSCAPPAGMRRLREAIAHHIGTSRGLTLQADDVLVTNGAQQAIDLVARVLATHGDRVAVEDPGYGTPRRLLQAQGLEVCGVRVDAEGLVVSELPAGVRIVYVSPSHQFPFGVAMSLSRRLALLEWARANDAAIIEDDYDSEFRFDGRPLETLHALDGGRRVLYVGSFSKSMLPTLRLGYLVAPASLHGALAAAKYLADWSSPLVAQATLARFIEDGLFARHLRRMRMLYEQRHRVIVRQLNDAFGETIEIVPSAAGLHVTALLRGTSVAAIETAVRRASAAGVECTPLSLHAVGERKLAGLVLGYGAIETERIPEGIAALRQAFEA
jgi:GntR family transcriptional regulator/MocR family aminotransferase